MVDELETFVVPNPSPHNRDSLEMALMLNWGCASNLFIYCIHAEMALKEIMLMKAPMHDIDKKNRPTQQRLMPHRVPAKPNFKKSPENSVTIITNAAEIAVNFDQWMLVVEIGLVYFVYCDTHKPISRFRPQFRKKGGPRRMCSRGSVAQEHWDRIPDNDSVDFSTQSHTHLDLRSVSILHAPQGWKGWWARKLWFGLAVQCWFRRPASGWEWAPVCD